MPSFEEIFADSPDATGVGQLDLVRVNETPVIVVRVNETPVIVVLFTKKAVGVKTHYLGGSVNCEIQCNCRHEQRCLLCDLQDKAITRHLLLVYLVEADAVAVLRVSDTRSPYALGPKLAAEIRQDELDKRFLLISRVSNKFAVTSVPAKDGQDMGERIVRQFVERQRVGEIDLTRAIPIYPNADLFNVPELERKATAMGFSKSDYVAGGPNDKGGGGASAAN